MTSGRPEDTKHPRWRRILALKTAGFSIFSATLLAMWILGYRVLPSVAVLVAAGLLLNIACWFAPDSRREGVWQLAEVADMVAFPAFLWAMAFHDFSLGWWWLFAGPAVVFLAVLVTMGVHSCYLELRYWPEFSRQHPH